MEKIKEQLPWFLKDDNIRDINGKRPSDKGYDDTTCHIFDRCWKEFIPLMH